MRAEKQLLLDEIKQQIHAAKALVVTSYEKFSPEKMWGFSQELRKSGNHHFEVVKKRILKKALEDMEIDLQLDHMPGHIGVLFMDEDALTAIKAFYEMKSSGDNGFVVQKGIIDNCLYNASEIEDLSKLPGKNELRSQFLALFDAPAQQMVSVMDNLLTSVIFCLENKVEKEKK